MKSLTVSMTPAFYYEGDWLLRAQLRCLSEQVAKDFTVLLIDPHFSKRNGYMDELRQHYKLDIVHVPYTPNQNIAKRLDCAVFNAAYCYSESPRIVRYSCWRFVTPDFTKCCLESKGNVDFYFHSCHPKSAPHAETNHDTTIWNFGSDRVDWNAIPKVAGRPGATWGVESDKDSPSTLFPVNGYGNYMVMREQWLGVNGCNEAQCNTAHYEDMEFCIRARNAKLQCERKAHKLYRLHHWYGSFSGRANLKPDHDFKKNCGACEKASQTLEPNRFDWPRRAAAGEIELFERDRAWVCKACFLCGPMYSKDPSEHLTAISRRGITQAPIIPKYKIGRNIRILTADMDGKSLADKIEIYNRSWTDRRYYAI
jgi:hypothetical protein